MKEDKSFRSTNEGQEFTDHESPQEKRNYFGPRIDTNFHESVEKKEAEWLDG